MKVLDGLSPTSPYNPWVTQESASELLAEQMYPPLVGDLLLDAMVRGVDDTNTDVHVALQGYQGVSHGPVIDGMTA